MILLRAMPTALALLLPLSGALAQTVPGPGEASARTAPAGGIAIEAPWLRATPGGARVAGGYVTIHNAGPEPDTLPAAAIPQAGRGEIHSMSMEGGVMKMAPVEGGLALAPGAHVTLKPGGYHLMFQDLKAGLKAGETVAGSLTFARAGTVPVVFTVAPVGAPAPGRQGHQHQH